MHGGLAEEICLWVGNEDRAAGVTGNEFTVEGFKMEDKRFGEATGCNEGLGVAGIGQRRWHNDYKSVEERCGWRWLFSCLWLLDFLLFWSETHR